MKAITIKQPFATLIALGLKEYEFRTWKTSYRGGLLIHAGKSIDREAMARFAHLGLEYPTGCVVAKAVLADCVPVDSALRALLAEQNYAVYAGTIEAVGWQGYGFRLENVQPVKPLPAKGKLGLWELCEAEN